MVLLMRSRRRGRTFVGAWAWAWREEEVEHNVDSVEVGTGVQGEAWCSSDVLQRWSTMSRRDMGTMVG